jgi:hypothetical protein
MTEVASSATSSAPPEDDALRRHAPPASETIFLPGILRAPFHEELAFDLPDQGESFRFVRRPIGIKEVVVAGASVYREDTGYSDARKGSIAEGAAR